jgi:predicted DNA-binding transcriptional regulator YafY
VDKLERLLNLTATLLDTSRPLTAEDLRERVPGYPDGLPAFRRAFERDKEDLREMGIPITMEPIEGEERVMDGYTIRASDYYLRDPGLEPDELAALNLAASAVKLEGVQGIEALWKLGGTVDVGSSGELASLPSDPALVPLFGAIVDCRAVTFRYRGSERTADRTLDPYRLDYRRGHWYVTGRDHASDESRNFRVDRIEGELAVGDPGAFVRPEQLPDEPAQPWEFGEGEPVAARLLVDGRQVRWARQHLGEGAVVEERDDGSVVFEVPVTNWPAFRGLVLTFLEHAEVLAPPELRADMISWLEAVAGGPGARPGRSG